MGDDTKVPLLEKVYYDDCSGCRIQKSKDTQQGVPWKTLATIWIIVLCNGTSSDSDTSFDVLDFLLEFCGSVGIVLSASRTVCTGLFTFGFPQTSPSGSCTRDWWCCSTLLLLEPFFHLVR